MKLLDGNRTNEGVGGGMRPRKAKSGLEHDKDSE